MNATRIGHWLRSAVIIALAGALTAGCSSSTGSTAGATTKARTPIGATGRSFPSVDFPRFTNEIARAKDIRNSPAPPFAVSQWITSEPDGGDRVVIIDFWATWCPPCRQSIPHMNELAKRFGDDVVAIGLSDEPPADFQSGMQKYRLDPGKFSYSLALDPAARMFNALAIQGIPHTMVISSDWVVRWQGHPLELDEATLRQIVDANKKMTAGAKQS